MGRHSPANDVIGVERDKLRRRYTDCLIRLAGLYEMKGSLKKAEGLYKRLIVFDPLYETAYQKLMINYSNRGKTNDATQTYQELEELLRSELDATPDELTRSIYANILSKN